MDVSRTEGIETSVESLHEQNICFPQQVRPGTAQDQRHDGIVTATVPNLPASLFQLFRAVPWRERGTGRAILTIDLSGARQLGRGSKWRCSSRHPRTSECL